MGWVNFPLVVIFRLSLCAGIVYGKFGLFWDLFGSIKLVTN